MYPSNIPTAYYYSNKYLRGLFSTPPAFIRYPVFNRENTVNIVIQTLLKKLFTSLHKYNAITHSLKIVESSCNAEMLAASQINTTTTMFTVYSLLMVFQDLKKKLFAEVHR